MGIFSLDEGDGLPERHLESPILEGIDDLIEIMAPHYAPESLDLVRQAYTFSEKAHAGQFRRSGEPYITHPLGVAAILCELHLDVATIVTGLLHDTVEDTAVTLADVERDFGPTVRDLVDGVTKISQMKFRHTHEKQGENVRKMIVSMGKDVRVILVKIADRLHNMRTLNHMPYEKQARIAEETLDIYAPLAGRLGIMSVKVELEDLSFRYAHPDQYYELVQKVAKKRRERERYIDEVKRILTQEIRSRSKLEFEIQGRPKHLYSIFKKMQSRNVDYDQIYDVLAFRVIVGTVAECYEVLGVVHSLWKPIPGRFKDFIAMPKLNDYRSLHTAVMGPQAERIEIQIRTGEMHRVAEWGIAAHWKYKEESRAGRSITDVALDKFNWLRELVSLHQQSGNADEFLENIKTDLADSEIYVFTPKGEVREFPEGATPVDFAYAIHTDLGHRIVGARVNGRIVSLKHRLQSGDTVEVITSKTQAPSKDWLKFCVTSKAKAKIRAHVKGAERDRALDLGREILEKALRKRGASLQKQLVGANFEKYLREQGCHTQDELFVRVGYGKISPEQVLAVVLPPATEPQEPATHPNFIQRAFKMAATKKKSSSVIKVDGMDDVLVRYAKCCHPIPGDPIVGFISLGRGISVHRADCEKALAVDQERSIDVEWNTEKAAEDTGRVVRVRVVSHDTAGLLKNMSEVFVNHGVNIFNAQIRTTRDRKGICIFDVGVRDTAQLSAVMMDLEKLKGVLGVTRLTHT